MINEDYHWTCGFHLSFVTYHLSLESENNVAPKTALYLNLFLNLAPFGAKGSCPVTVVYMPPLVITDGNKHAVAYYENMKAENRQDINLELFFLTPVELHL